MTRVSLNRRLADSKIRQINEGVNLDFGFPILSPAFTKEN